MGISCDDYISTDPVPARAARRVPAVTAADTTHGRFKIIKSADGV
jgi:hypothetical protein